jgi:hypothetical protein
VLFFRRTYACSADDDADRRVPCARLDILFLRVMVVHGVSTAET